MTTSDREISPDDLCRLVALIEPATKGLGNTAYAAWADQILLAFEQIERRLVFCRGEFRCYSIRTGCFMRLNELELHGLVLDCHAPGSTPQIVKAIKVYAYKSDDYFSAGRNALTCLDGTILLDLNHPTDRIRFERHSPDYRTLDFVPVRYLKRDGEQEAKSFLQDTIGDPIAIERLMELVGLSLVGEGCRYQRLVLLKGDGLNGKGALLNLISSLVPVPNRTSITGKELTYDYGRAPLLGSRLNALGELDRYSAEELTTLKTLVSGEPISARFVGGNGFTLNPIALHIAATNHLPSLGRKTMALVRRFVVISCENSIALNDQDPLFSTRLAERCGSGFLGLCIDAARRALDRWERGDFKFEMSPEMEHQRDQLFGQSPLEQFVASHLVKTGDVVKDQLRISEVRDAYERFCGQLGINPLSASEFKSELANLGIPSRKSSIIILLGVRWCEGASGA
jgi:phage/plasmid-associated DNA primase